MHLVVPKHVDYKMLDASDEASVVSVALCEGGIEESDVGKVVLNAQVGLAIGFVVVLPREGGAETLANIFLGGVPFALTLVVWVARGFLWRMERQYMAFRSPSF